MRKNLNFCPILGPGSDRHLAEDVKHSRASLFSSAFIPIDSFDLRSPIRRTVENRSFLPFLRTEVRFQNRAHSFRVPCAVLWGLQLVSRYLTLGMTSVRWALCSRARVPSCGACLNTRAWCYPWPPPGCPLVCSSPEQSHMQMFGSGQTLADGVPSLWRCLRKTNVFVDISGLWVSLKKFYTFLWNSICITFGQVFWFLIGH